MAKNIIFLLLCAVYVYRSRDPVKALLLAASAIIGWFLPFDLFWFLR